MSCRWWNATLRDESLPVREELRAAAAAGDVHALNSLGVTCERDGDFLTAAAIYAVIAGFFRKKKLGKSPFAAHRKNQAIVDGNLFRASSLLRADERERFDTLLGAMAEEFPLVEPCGSEKRFVDGDAYARRSPRYRHERIHCWTPVVSIVLAYWVFAFLLGLSGVFPESFGPVERHFQGLDDVFGLWVFVFMIITTPFRYPFMLLKWFGAIAAVFLIHAWITDAVPLIAAFLGR